MTRKETIKGVVGIILAMSVGLCWLPIGELLGLTWLMIIVFIYIMQLAVVPYAHNFLYNKKWYSATLITLCASNVLHCIAFAVKFGFTLNEHIAQDVGEGFVTFELLFIFIPVLIFLIIYTSITTAVCIVSYNKRKGSFK